MFRKQQMWEEVDSIDEINRRKLTAHTRGSDDFINYILLHAVHPKQVYFQQFTSNPINKCLYFQGTSRALTSATGRRVLIGVVLQDI